MDRTTQELLAQIEQEKRRRQDAEAEARSERRLREGEQRRREGEQRRREEVEQQIQDSTLPEFLDTCHVQLFLGLNVQEDKRSSTKGDPSNADRKLRPDKIQEWTDFPKEQTAIWEDLMDADFVTERHFTPLFALKIFGKQIREKMLSSELDLSYFERQTVESLVASVIKQLYANPRLRQTFHLNGDVTFENHANTLTDESKIVADMGSLSLTQEKPPRRSKRLAAKRSDEELVPAPLPVNNQTRSQLKPARPRADQFCVYNRGPDEKVPAFIIEYKPPHKVSLAHVKAGLEDMELNQVVRYQEDKKPEDICRRVVAAVITQAFFYMITGGLEYGYVCTGEAFIFLRVLDSDPSTVYYYLSIPKEDVGETTGWTGDLNCDNRLHLTALGQVLAFTLRALRTAPRDLGWRNWAMSKLKTWEIIYDVLLTEISEKNVPSSDFKPSPQTRREYCRVSPVKTRSRSAVANVASCNPSQGLISLDRDDSDDEFDPNTPSRRPRDSRLPRPSAWPSLSAGATTSQGDAQSKGKSRQYCTQLCLRGLATGGKLDWECSNVLDHGVDRHQINATTLIGLLDRQLCSGDLRPDLELGCESLHIHGSRGALFKVTLLSNGYTFVGKGVPVEFVDCLKHEESVYSRLSQIQGIHVPVLLGSLALSRPFYYDGIAEIVHMMFMGYAGRTLAKRHEIDQSQLTQQAEDSLHAIHRLGVLHSDPIPGNMTWNKENGRVMFIDFERAKFQNPRMPLGPVSPNNRRKRALYDKRRSKCFSSFERETLLMRHDLQSVEGVTL
ncbi:hypothetical protein RJ035_003249 [Blastomyces gilchristii]